MFAAFTTPDGKTVFISGDAKFIVQPVP